jgi:hypothetical protein
MAAAHHWRYISLSLYLIIAAHDMENIRKGIKIHPQWNTSARVLPLGL